MLLTLRSLLWRHGVAGAITGTCATDQSAQNAIPYGSQPYGQSPYGNGTNQVTSAVGEIPALGGGYWAHFGERHWSAPRKKPAVSVPLPISLPAVAAISGYAETGQAAASSAASGHQTFTGAVGGSQVPTVAASGIVLLAIGGAVTTEQLAAATRGEAAMVDVELELFAAMLLGEAVMVDVELELFADIFLAA